MSSEKFITDVKSIDILKKKMEEHKDMPVQKQKICGSIENFVKQN